MNSEHKKLWFKAKKYGWGWTPASWEGWLVSILFIIVCYATVKLYELVPLSESEYGILVTLTIIAHSFVLIGICYLKGEKPRWQWGDPQK